LTGHASPLSVENIA